MSETPHPMQVVVDELLSQENVPQEFKDRLTRQWERIRPMLLGNAEKRERLISDTLSDQAAERERTITRRERVQKETEAVEQFNLAVQNALEYQTELMERIARKL